MSTYRLSSVERAQTKWKLYWIQRPWMTLHLMILNVTKLSFSCLMIWTRSRISSSTWTCQFFPRKTPRRSKKEEMYRRHAWAFWDTNRKTSSSRGITPLLNGKLSNPLKVGRRTSDVCSLMQDWFLPITKSRESWSLVVVMYSTISSRRYSMDMNWRQMYPKKSY